MSGGKAAASPAASAKRIRRVRDGPRTEGYYDDGLKTAGSFGPMIAAGAESVLSLEVRLSNGVFKPARLAERAGQRAIWQLGDVQIRVFFASGSSTFGVKRTPEDSPEVSGRAKRKREGGGSPAESSPGASPAAPAAPATPAVEVPDTQGIRGVPAAWQSQESQEPQIRGVPAAWAAGTVTLGADGMLTSRKKRFKEGERSFKCKQCGKG